MTFEEILARDGTLVYKTKGKSMQPMLKENRDLVTVTVPHGRLQPYDVALYRRGKNCVLHRVIRVKADHYLIRGDNTFEWETVRDEDVIGVLTGFQRKGKPHSVSDRGYRLYARVWNALYPLRYGWFRCRRLLVRVLEKLGLLQFVKRMLHRS